MSEETPDIIMSPAEKMKNLITIMIFRDSYWGYLFSRLRRQEDRSINSIMGVAAESDGSLTLIYNPDWFDGTSDDILKLIIEHEGIHILNNHIGRFLRIMVNEVVEERKMMKVDKWNQASDAATNCMIKNLPDQMKIGSIDNFVPIKAKFLGLPDDKTSEFYFTNIIDKEDQSGNEKGKGKSGKGYSGGFGGKKPMKLIDDHNCWGKNITQTPDLNSLSRRVEQYASNLALESYKEVKDRGKLPAGVYDLIKEILKPPQVPYYQIIAKLIKGSKFSKFRRAYSRINRKRTYLFTIGDKKNIPKLSPFPGRTKDFTFTITIILDTSGSMNREDILEGLSGAKNIIQNDRHVKTTIIECDAKVQKEYRIKKINDIQFNIKGRGGTELFPALERAKKINSDVTLTFTDGFCDNINSIEKRYLPKKMIWVITKRGHANMVNKRGFVITLDKELKQRRTN